MFSLTGLFQSFEAGKNYVITVTIGPDPIQFDGGVQDWSSFDADNLINYNQ